MTLETNNTREYDIRFSRDLERGEVGQKFTEEWLNSGDYEIKTDSKAQETGNLYVEYAQRWLDGKWKPSGIETSDSDYWIFASPTGKGAIIIHADELKELIAELRYTGSIKTGEQRIVTQDTNGSVGYLITPQQILEKLLLLPKTEREREKSSFEKDKEWQDTDSSSLGVGTSSDSSVA